MTAKNPIPAKLRARRVREYVEQVLRDLRAERVPRDAVRCCCVTEPTWDCLDLYTIALDMAEDEALRVLVTQARSMIAAELIKRSTNPE